MSHQVLAIAGSPRRGGNSETLLEHALRGVAAGDSGARVEKMVLNELTLRPCQNCGYCERHGVCRFADADDMKIIYPLLDTCDRFVVASPIYFASVSAQLKVMLDRCQPYWVRRFLRRERHPNSDRKGLFLCVGGFEHDRFYRCARRVIKTWCICLDIELVGDLFYPGIDRRGEMAKHPNALKAAFEAGRRLVAPSASATT